MSASASSASKMLADGTAVFTGLAAAGAALPIRPLHLAVGMFDGVHLGHRAVIAPAVARAQTEGGLAAALTFDPHPSRLLRPHEAVALIQPLEQRIRHLLATGLHAVIVQPFTAELAALEAEVFVDHMRQHLPGLHTLYVGENWRFGRGRRGDVALLRGLAQAAGIGLVSAERLQADGETVSSTRIRAFIEQGDIQRANTLLGYAYVTRGTVEPGKRLGRTIGFPTLNVAWNPECRPRLGVYVLRVRGQETGEPWLPAVGNYGLRPTVESQTVPRLEIHVLAPCPWTEGARLEIEWLDYLRPEQRFASVDELRAQIAHDVAAARAWHERAADRARQ